MVSSARQGNRQQSRRLVYTVSFSGETITNIYGFVLTDMRSISDSNPFSCLHSEQQQKKSKPYLYVICNSHTQCKSVFAHKNALTWMGNMNDRFWPVWNLAWTQRVRFSKGPKTHTGTQTDWDKGLYLCRHLWTQDVLLGLHARTNGGSGGLSAGN